MIKNKLSLFSIALLILVAISSCAKKITFQTSPYVPAARGYVKVKKDSNKNYVVQIHLNDLAEVQRLEPTNQTYIVWLNTAEEKPKNIGKITSSAATFSNNLKASFETVSSTRPTQIFITAEEDPGVQMPGSKIILTTDSF
ncbi:hypothetical protein [Flavihumibacter profundi]|jgi:hypothetical protein|uniref:hypothetical protein n=1 Tax=Flavihumibacter profundi TaxID=2716883 RepID=UPI001CC3FD1D|nr:hypothetical protein [Flavihumibacter profundi]MBZ5857000.1 hypothetical protein [Flavihumibacter profundi]